jgi:hypothetical protein
MKLGIEELMAVEGKDAPRVTQKMFDENIIDTEVVMHITKSGQILRWGVLTTKSGFAVTGSPSACASSANDIPEYGETLAIENARKELWPLMGYALKQGLMSG